MAKRISELPAAGSAADSDQLELNQSGTSRRATRAQVLASAAPLVHTHPLSDITDITSPSVAVRDAFQNNLGLITETGTFAISGVLDAELTGVRGHYHTVVKLENPVTPAVVQLPDPAAAQFAGLEQGWFCDIRAASGSQPASVTALVTDTFRHANGYNPTIQVGNEDTVYLGYSRATAIGQFFKLYRETDIWTLYGPFRLNETDDLAFGDLANLDEVDTAQIADDAVGPDQIANTAVTPASYTSADITVDAQGRVTAAANGAGGGGGIPATIVDAKGDLIVATAADTVARLAVGSNGQVATADSAEATGIKWATPGATNSENVTIVAHASGDTRAAIQAAIGVDGAHVKLEAARVYEVEQDGVGYDVRTTTPIRACLVIAPGVTFDLNGSTIKLADSQNAFVIINQGITTNVGSGPTQRDADITIKNGTLDGNRANQSSGGIVGQFEEQGCLAMQSCDQVRLNNLNFNSSQCYGSRLLDMRDGIFTNLSSADVRGDAMGFGLGQSGGVDLEVFDSTIDNLICVRAEGGYDFPGTGRGFIQGNPWIGDFIRCNMGDSFGRNCGGGNKIQNASRDSCFGSLTWSGVVLPGEGDFNTTNCGTKVQGSPGRPRNIQISAVHSDNCQIEALRLTDCDLCSVASVHSRNNNLLNPAANQDLTITGDRCSIGTLHLENTNNVSVFINADGASFTVDKVISDGHTGDLFSWNSDNNTILIGQAFVDGSGRLMNNNGTGEIAHVGVMAITGATTEDNTKESNANITYGLFLNNRT